MVATGRGEVYNLLHSDSEGHALKPASFRYVKAETLEQAIDALTEHGDEAKVLAGGQSLVPLMNLRLALPAVLVDVNGIRELDGVSVNGSVEIGAISRQLAVESSVGDAAPLVAEALRHVGHPAIRSRGTFGGTVAHGDPAAEIPAVLLALGGNVVARGPGGERVISADDLFVTHFTTALEPTEILTRVRIPRAGAGQRWGFAEVARRQGDFALAGVAATADVDPDGVCRAARIVLFGVADRPLRAAAAEAALHGQKLVDPAALYDAGQLAAEGLEPRADIHASSRYRREVAAVLVRRALGQAAAR